ncbi:hypothetical protein L3Q82_022338, partial [Scortum barcoo]
MSGTLIWQEMWSITFAYLTQDRSKNVQDAWLQLMLMPLTDLTKGYAATQHGRKQGAGKNKEYLKESEPFNKRWDQSCTDAFKRIIQCLINAPVLAFADPGKPYVLHTDASFKGLHLNSLEQFSKADLIEAQRKDDVLRTVIEAVKHRVWPRCKDMSPEIRLLKREAGRLVMRDGLLCRVGNNSNDKTLQLVLP